MDMAASEEKEKEHTTAEMLKPPPPDEGESNDMAASKEKEHTTAEMLNPPPPDGSERAAFVKLDPAGFHLRPPPPPHHLNSYITPDALLFQTTHMGAAVLDPSKFLLVIDGLVQRSFALSFDMLRALPRRDVTAVHECYGSPLKPPSTPLGRVGNVRWTGVSLNVLLALADPLPGAKYVWSDGLDRGEFGGVVADRYRKDLPLAKAMEDEVLLAYEVNGQPLGRERGGPVRLVVPGWFGTNSTKWVCRVSVQGGRAEGPFTTTFYNELGPGPGPNGFGGGELRSRPVWEVEVNSMIVRPRPGEVVGSRGGHVLVEGWAWHHEPIERVLLGVDGLEGPDPWREARVEERFEFGWQKFSQALSLEVGSHKVIARATSRDGTTQPVGGRRNRCHAVSFEVVD